MRRARSGLRRSSTKISDVAAAVNYATATARVTAPSAMPVQTLITVIEDAGYSARDSTLPGGGDDDRAGDRDVAYLRRRLILALVFFVPLTDLSLLLSVVPADRFPRVAVGSGRLRGAGGAVGRVAVSPGRAGSGPAAS